jgi:3-oxoacyl-[acyl-carrier protein] reductase
MMNVTDVRVAVVTGGGGGIGRAVSLGLAAHGVRVLVNDFSRGEDGVGAADRVVEEIRAAGGEAAASYHSVASFDSCAAIIDSAVQAFGRLDILVMCAGNLVPASLDELTEEDLDRSFAVHVKGHLGCSKYAARQMIKQGDGGRIIMFGSRNAWFNPKYPAYGSAKAAIMGLSSHLSETLKEHGITVNCMLPSAQTQLFSESDPSKRSGGGKPTRLGRMPASTDLSPDTVAPVIVYLASLEGGHLTGEFVYASGSDVCFYRSPFGIKDRNVLLRKQGTWTPEEIGQVLPP